LVLSVPATAGEKIKGTTYYAVEAQNIKTGEKTGYWIWHGKGISSPVAGPVGSHPVDCHGAGFWDADGAWSEGTCVHTVNDDSYIAHWKRERGQKVGQFKYLSGTGKFEGITGGGTYETAQRFPDRQSTDWEGEMTLK
jgi:hypothetical protein